MNCINSISFNTYLHIIQAIKPINKKYVTYNKLLYLRVLIILNCSIIFTTSCFKIILNIKFKAKPMVKSRSSLMTKKCNIMYECIQTSPLHSIKNSIHFLLLKMKNEYLIFFVHKI